MTVVDAINGLFAAHPQRDFIVISHAVDRDLHLELSGALAVAEKAENCTVFLTTFGGDPDGGYRIARCLRHSYKHVRLVVPSYCKSAGTLIAIAADEIAMGDLGELGPLDIQVLKGSELQENSSGLDIMQALQQLTSHTEDTFHRLLVQTRNFGLSTKLCAEFAADVASGLMAPLIGQIDPIRLGEMERATRVAFDYGSRLNAYAQNLTAGALGRLIMQYPSHGFVIDRREARELFKRVSHPSEAEQTFVDSAWARLHRPAEIDPVVFFQSQHQKGADNERADEEGQPEEAADPGGEGEANVPPPNDVPELPRAEPAGGQG